MKSVMSLPLIVCLTASAPAAIAQEKSGAGLSDFAWANLRTLRPGTELLITVRGSQPGRRTVVGATEAELTVLNLGDPALPPAARSALLNVVLKLS